MRYKGTHHMSSSAFETLSTAVVNIKSSIPRSASIHSIAYDVPILKQQRKVLYETLPFLAAHGMQHRENKIRRVLSAASVQSLEDMGTEVSQAEVSIC